MVENQISRKITVFQGRTAPEEALLVGYGALIDAQGLVMPLPRILTLISSKKRVYNTAEWKVLSTSYAPEDTIYGHLVFALKYEGVNLLFFKKIFEQVEKRTIESWVKSEPLGQYSRRIWFLYEWLMQRHLEIPKLKEGNYVSLIDEDLQYASSIGVNSSRHRIKNNLVGTVNFCPLIYKTEKLERYIHENLSEKTNVVIKDIHKDILLRTSAFLMLKDSKASFSIEGEVPSQNRAVRWGRAIGEAGKKPFTKDELLRLQQIVIDNSRFVKFGFRKQGGFVGEHDRTTGEPIPEHISARYQDVELLVDGLLETASMFEEKHFNPVLTAACIAFGFVFIHPFVDGNGRIHRYIVHHLLSKMNFTPQGIIFPVSAAILARIDDYKKVLESFSHPLLDFIEWKRTPDNNVEVLNDTLDYYRYFDATLQAEFLFECVDDTISTIIPQEVDYIQKYDAMRVWLDNEFQMDNKTIALLVRFLEQGNGKLSKRSKEKELPLLTEKEVKAIEGKYAFYFEK